MKLKPFLPVLIIITVIGGAAGIVLAYNPIGQETISITSEGSVPLTPGPLVDDFNNTSGVNLWNCATSTCVKDGSTAVLSATYTGNPSVAYGASGHSLQLTFDVTANDSWAAYVTPLGDAGISDYNYLSFWVKGTAGGVGELFKIELHHADFYSGPVDASHPIGYNNNYKAGVYVTDYLNGGITTTWKKVTIPLDAFVNITDRTKMKEIVFSFESWQSAVNGSPQSGIIYIDNISFGKQFLGYVHLNNFNKKGPVPNTASINNATGGVSNALSWDGTTHNNTANAVSSQYTSPPYGLQFNFSGVSAHSSRWDAYYMILGGGDTGWVESPRDFSRYSQLSFCIKGNVGNEYGIRAELNCSERATYIFLKNIISTTWSKKTIPLSSFKDRDQDGAPKGASVNNATLKKCAFVYTYWLWYWNYPARVDSGTIFIDDVQFETAGFLPDTEPPNKPLVPNISGSGELTLTTYIGGTDPSMENMRFEYLSGAETTWKTIGYDYDTQDGSYKTTWDTTGLTPGSYSVRAVAMDSVGRETPSKVKTYIAI